MLGSSAYVADGGGEVGIGGLQVIDVANPASPLLVGSCDTSGFACGVHLASSYAYVADGSAGLEVIDISDPSTPTWKGVCNTTGFASGVCPFGDYAYVADGSGEYEAGGLQVIDASTPNWYYFPALMVNSAQDVVIGFSGSSCNSYIGAYYSWRRGPCTAMEGPVLIQAGEDYFDNSRWGDYSCTSLDPGDPDGMSIWTVQEYASESPLPLYIRRWGTWIARIRPFD